MDNNNLLLAPIHGISLRDYSAASAKIASGMSVEDTCKALGIEPAVWEEVNILWSKRMQEDGTWTVTTLFGQYFGEANNHPKLGNLDVATLSPKGQENLQKMKDDKYFYHELVGARVAAYEAGLDGAQWILDEFGIPLGEFQSVEMQWMQQRNHELANGDGQNVAHFMQYQQMKLKEYTDKFSAEQGGNIADDIEF